MISGPYLVDAVWPGLAAELGTLWTAVTRAGGSVGFMSDAPEEEIRAAAERVIEDVLADREQLIVIVADGELAGTVFLRRGNGPRIAHRAELLRLMVQPNVQGQGWGRALLDAAVDHARTMGLEQLLLSARGGTDLPAFYEKLGWTPVGVWPGALRLGPGPDDLRDEHWFQLRLSADQGRMVVD